MADVVDYDLIVSHVRCIVAAGHIELVEYLAERLAADCLVDKRIKEIVVRVEKLDVYTDAAAVGVEIEKENENILI